MVKKELNAYDRKNVDIILNAMKKNKDYPMWVSYTSSISRRIKISQTSVRKHLIKLEDKGFINKLDSRIAKNAKEYKVTESGISMLYYIRKKNKLKEKLSRLENKKFALEEIEEK